MLKNNSYKRFWATFLIIMMFSIAQISLISAFTFDNVKSFDSNVGNYGKITIKDNFGLQDLYEAELKENTDTCGTSCSAETEIVLHQATSLVDDVRFINPDNNEEVSIKDYNIYYGLGTKEVLDYKRQCSDLGNGTDTCVSVQVGSHNVTNYVEYGVGTILSPGTYEIKLEGTKDRAQTVDWQIYSQGKWLDDWALWNGATSTGLISWYEFENSYNTSSKTSLGSYNLTLGTHAGGSDVATSVLPFVLGKLGQGIYNNGSTQNYLYNRTTTIPSFQAGTMEAWVRFNDSGGNQGILSHSSTTNNHVNRMQINNGDTWLCHVASNGNGAQNFFNSTSFTDTGITVDTWYHFACSWNETAIDLFIDGELKNSSGRGEGTGYPGSGVDGMVIGTVCGQVGSCGATGTPLGINGTIDNIMFWNITRTAEEILSDAQIGSTLNFPADNADLFVGDTTIFNSSITKANLKNATLTVWNPDNSIFGKNTTLVTGDSNTSLNTLAVNVVGDNYKWNVEYCDTSHSCVSAVNNRTFNVKSFLVNSQTFTTPTLTGNTENFNISITYDSTEYTNIIGTLVYNNTDYTGTKIGTGDTVTYTRQLTVPTVSTQTNFSFYWEFTLNNGSNNYFNSTFNNQTVNTISIDDCSTNSVLVLNYTLKDEETQTVLTGTTINSTIEVDVDVYTTAGTLIQNYSGNWSTNSNAQICLNQNLTTEQYRLDATAFYDGIGYAQEFHNIQQFVLQNSSIPQQIDLFDLPDASTTQFLIIFKDSSFLPVEDALIDITRKYISEGVFKSVEIPLTDFSGQATGSFDTTGAIYTIIVKKNGVILATFENVAVFCEDAVIGDCKLNLNSQEGTSDFPNWNLNNGVNYEFTFNEGTRTVSVVFTVSDGSTKTLNLNVTKYDRFGNNTVCSDDLTSSSGTLSCVIPQSFGNVTVISTLSATGSPLVIIGTKIYSIKESARELFGNSGYIMVIILLITLPMLMISNKTGFIIAIFIGLVFAGALTLYDTESFIGKTSSIMWFLIAGGVIIWRMSKE